MCHFWVGISLSARTALRLMGGKESVKVGQTEEIPVKITVTVRFG